MDYSMPITILTQKDLLDAGCYNIGDAISVVEGAFVKYAHGDVIFPDKISVIFDQKSQNRINCLPAAIPSEKVYGMKWVSVFPGNPHERNKPNLSAVYILSELETGYPLAFMEGTLCSNLRTASVGAVAAKYLARKNSETIGFIGGGEEAKNHLLTMKTVLPGLKRCYVSSRTADTEKVFIEQMKKRLEDVEFIACDSSYEKAVRDADVVVTAISGQEKILRREWIKEGAFYCHVGGLEDDFGVPALADKIVCDKWDVVKHRTQTISQMYKQGLLRDEDIFADLHEIITGQKPGRENDKEFVYFNSVGMSFVDTEIAYWMYQKCVGAGKGKKINFRETPLFD